MLPPMSEQRVRECRSSLQKSKNLSSWWGERWNSSCSKERCPAGILSTVLWEILCLGKAGPCHKLLKKVWQYFWQGKLGCRSSDRPSTDISSEVTQCMQSFKVSIIHRLRVLLLLGTGENLTSRQLLDAEAWSHRKVPSNFLSVTYWKQVLAVLCMWNLPFVITHHYSLLWRIKFLNPF